MSQLRATSVPFVLPAMSASKHLASSPSSPVRIRPIAQSYDQRCWARRPAPHASTATPPSLPEDKHRSPFRRFCKRIWYRCVSLPGKPET